MLYFLNEIVSEVLWLKSHHKMSRMKSQDCTTVSQKGYFLKRAKSSIKTMQIVSRWSTDSEYNKERRAQFFLRDRRIEKTVEVLNLCKH